MHIKQLDIPFTLVKVEGGKLWINKDYNIDNKLSIYIPKEDIVMCVETSISELLITCNRHSYWSNTLNTMYKLARTPGAKRKIKESIKIRKHGVMYKLSFIYKQTTIKTNDIVRISTKENTHE